jgi:hypothetical protein
VRIFTKTDTGFGARRPKTRQPAPKFSRSEGNSPQFDEKAEIFRGHDQHWNEAIGLDHGHANRHAL